MSRRKLHHLAPRSAGLVRVPIVLMAFAAASLAGCGDGGNGGPIGPPGTATLAAPSLTTSGGQRETGNLALRTSRAAAGLQVDVVFPPDVIPAVGGIVAIGRAGGLDGVSFQNLDRGRTRVLLFDTGGGASIAAGDGAVLRMTLPIAAQAPAGSFPIRLENALLVDEDGTAFELILEDGQVTVSG